MTDPSDASFYKLILFEIHFIPFASSSLMENGMNEAWNCAFMYWPSIDGFSYLNSTSAAWVSVSAVSNKQGYNLGATYIFLRHNKKPRTISN